MNTRGFALISITHMNLHRLLSKLCFTFGVNATLLKKKFVDKCLKTEGVQDTVASV